MCLQTGRGETHVSPDGQTDTCVTKQAKERHMCHQTGRGETHVSPDGAKERHMCHQTGRGETHMSPDGQRRDTCVTRRAEERHMCQQTGAEETAEGEYPGLSTHTHHRLQPAEETAEGEYPGFSHTPQAPACRVWS